MRVGAASGGGWPSKKRNPTAANSAMAGAQRMVLSSAKLLDLASPVVGAGIYAGGGRRAACRSAVERGCRTDTHMGCGSETPVLGCSLGKNLPFWGVNIPEPSLRRCSCWVTGL
jgi:hypothetical protein